MTVQMMRGDHGRNAHGNGDVTDGSGGRGNIEPPCEGQVAKFRWSIEECCSTIVKIPTPSVV